MDIFSLVNTLQKNPELCSVFDYKAIQTYVEVITLLKPKLSTYLASYQSGPPPTLPGNVHDFLNKIFSMSDRMGKLAWESFRAAAWNSSFSGIDEEQATIHKHLKLFLQHGISRNIGIYNLMPPTRVCTDSSCSDPLHTNPTLLRDRELVEAKSYPITVFTKDLGAIPAFATSYYCRKCLTRYYPNYYVQNASSPSSVRVYYSETAHFIQSSQHFYIATDLCELFATMFVTSCTSATNCAHIYNQSLKNDLIAADLPADWQTSLKIDVEDIWTSFFLYSLVLEHRENNSILRLPHVAESQAKRLEPALKARNAKMSGPGQEAWSHACNRCCHVYQDADGNYYQIRSTVTDGVTVGRPTCSEHDCTEPLRSVKDHYCSTHRAQNKICAVVTCKQASEAGYRTCSDISHQKIEVYQHQQGKAMFQLKRRLERLKVSHTHDSFSSSKSKPKPPPSRFLNEETSTSIADFQPVQADANSIDNNNDEVELEGAGADGDEDVLVDENGVCDGKSDAGNRAPRARFGRRWTHNEELCVASCGVILGRATFYGSEAANGVRTFWMKLFPTRSSLPFVLWHDNNCRVVSMLLNDRDDDPRKDYFKNCALPVDVFHFKCKHKESDVECGLYCNPYLWPELRNDDGTWRFNSSAAEQANAWFGGFQAIVREMQVDRYEFFLDEMIKRRNRIIIAQLRDRGEAPYLIPREELLRPDSD